MSRMDSLLLPPTDAFQGEKLTVDSADETTPVYRAAAYVSLAIAALWAVSALVLWIL